MKGYVGIGIGVLIGLAGIARGLGKVGGDGAGTPKIEARAEAAAALRDGAASLDTLLQRFLEALQLKDRQALHALRLTEGEYRDIILPGTVPPGQPLKTVRPDVSEWAWSVLHTKSTYYEAFLLDSFGGHTYRVEGIAWKKGTQSYSNYTAYKQLELRVVDETGQEHEIRTGSIAEVDGAYKFISFIRD